MRESLAGQRRARMLSSGVQDLILSVDLRSLLWFLSLISHWWIVGSRLSLAFSMSRVRVNSGC